MSETAKEKKDREAREAAAERDQEQARLESERAEASTGEHPNQNATTAGRSAELTAVEDMVRGGTTPPVAYPQALPREEREENHRAMAEVAARNVTGTSDGVSSVLPAVGGVTNLGLTPAEVYAQLDDGAVDGRGRLVGTYLDDMQAEEAQRRRDRIEQMGTSPESKAAAAKIRELASSPGTPAADRDKPADEQGLIDPDKHTSSDDVDPNDRERRQREQVAANQ